jgi:hypothetical protein
MGSTRAPRWVTSRLRPERSTTELLSTQNPKHPSSQDGWAYHTLPWAHLNHPHSHLLRHTSSARGCSGQNPCSGTHPLHRSFGLQGIGMGEEESSPPESHWARVRQPREGSVCLGNGATEAVRKDGPGATDNSLQLAGSSLPSTQSLSLSQTQTRGMQRLVMEHWNWLGAQVTSAARWNRERGPYPLSPHSFGPPRAPQKAWPWSQSGRNRLSPAWICRLSIPSTVFLRANQEMSNVTDVPR